MKKKLSENLEILSYFQLINRHLLSWNSGWNTNLKVPYQRINCITLREMWDWMARICHLWNKPYPSMPHATQIILFLFSFMVAIYNQKINDQFIIESFLHWENQDWMPLLDDYFVTSNRHLLEIMKTWRLNRFTRINTVRGLLFALLFNLGLKNSRIQLIDINHTTFGNLKSIFDKLIKRCRGYFDRSNCITFYEEDVVNGVWDHNTTTSTSTTADSQNFYYSNPIKESLFWFSVIPYSTINHVVEIHVLTNLILLKYSPSLVSLPEKSTKSLPGLMIFVLYISSESDYNDEGEELDANKWLISINWWI